MVWANFVHSYFGLSIDYHIDIIQDKIILLSLAIKSSKTPSMTPQTATANLTDISMGNGIEHYMNGLDIQYVQWCTTIRYTLPLLWVRKLGQGG